MNQVAPRGGPPPSPPVSIGPKSSRSYSMNSNGAPHPSRPDRKYSAAMIEDQLQEHHRVLKRYLDAAANEDASYQPHNRARDKLLRLSAIQFQELSTDVYDELLRREEERRGTQSVPRFLLPKQNFHPKRNQARQKLSTLVTKKFRELSTDVLFELERRFPRFIDGQQRAASPSGSTRSSIRGGPPRMRRPSQGGRQPPPPPLVMPPNGMPMRRPSDVSMNSPGPYTPSIFNDPSRKQFQSNTMVPQKGIMVEDDESASGDEDASSGARSSRRTTNKSLPFSMGDHNLTADLQAQINELQQKLDNLESQSRQKDSQIREFEQQLQLERSKASDLNTTLEQQLKSAESLNSSLQLELETLKTQNEGTLSEHQSNLIEFEDLRSRHAQVLEDHQNTSSSQDDWASRYAELEKEFNNQQILVDEVRQDAIEHLQEMRQIVERASESADHEVTLQRKVKELEANVEEWKSRYAQARATASQGLNARTLTNGTSPDPASSMDQMDQYISPNGLVSASAMSQFQIAVQELLHLTHDGSETQPLEYMRSIISSVRAVTQDIEAPAPASADAKKLFESKDDGDLSKKRAKLKMKVSASTNNLITVSKTYAHGSGMVPVGLVDAATGHLVAAVVELVKVAGVRQDGQEEDDFR